jgi:GH43 family beta-xylosidase
MRTIPHAPDTVDTPVVQLLQHRAEAVVPSPGGTARREVRRRLLRLHRRRRVRHAFGTGTLAATMVAGGLQLKNGPVTGRVPAVEAPPLDDAAPAPLPPPAPGSPAPPTAPDVVPALSHDPAAGVDRDMADPGLLYAEGRYVVHATSARHCVDGVCRDDRVPTFVVSDLGSRAELVGDALPELPAWVAPDDPPIWAPQAARIDDHYVLYFAATSGRRGDGRMKCLGAAVGWSPEGPFAALPEPLWCTPGYWAIDPFPVVDGDRTYLLWRQDAPGHETGTIVVAPLRDDGLVVAGRPRALLVGESGWEDGYPGRRPGVGPIENPAMVRHPATGEWLLTWSANRWETQSYATGLAVCEGPTGPCERRSTDQPWVRTSGDPAVTTTARWGGAGGMSFAVGPDGTVHAVLHAYRDDGHHPAAPRVGWALRVEPDPTAPGGYRLVDEPENVGNQTGESSVGGA